MTIRGTLGLAAVLALLVGYLVATRPPPGLALEAVDHLTPPLGGATTVEMIDGSRSTTLARQDGTWGQPGVVDLLDTLAQLQVLGVIESAPSDPASYGFGPDALRLRVANDTGTIAEVEIGAMNPAGTGVYVRRGAAPAVLLVGALLRWEVEKVRRVAFKTVAP